MYCPKCGAKNVDEAKFCGECGISLASKPDIKPDPPQPNPPQPPKEAVSTELKIGVMVGTLIIPLIGLIMGWVYMKDDNADKKAVGKLWFYTGIGMSVIYVLYIAGEGY